MRKFQTKVIEQKNNQMEKCSRGFQQQLDKPEERVSELEDRTEKCTQSEHWKEKKKTHIKKKLNIA